MQICDIYGMRCSRDLRKRVIEFVRGGGSKREAARRFQVSHARVYNWTGVVDGLAYQRPGPQGPRRLDWQALRGAVAAHPDRTQQERARPFGVSRHCIWYALRRLGVSRKKTLGDKARDPQHRKAYLHLRERYRRRGKEFVYSAESGFAPCVTRHYAYAPTGRRVYGLRSGQRRPRTSLVAAPIADALTAPLLFEGHCNTALFTTWLQAQLCPLWHSNPVVVMDNVPFHQGALPPL